MNQSHGWREQVDSELSDLARLKLTTAKTVERTRIRLREIAVVLDGFAEGEEHAFAASVRAVADTMAVSNAAAAVRELRHRWDSIAAAGSEPAPADVELDAPSDAVSTFELTEPEETPAAATVDAVDDELAILASDAEMLGMFVAEALDHLGTIETVLLQLETTPGDQKLLNDVFRPFHTIKGNAGALGVTSVQELAHVVENLLDRARAGKHDMGVNEFDVVLKAVDLLTLMIQELPSRVAGKPPLDLTARRHSLIDGVGALLERGSGAAVAAPAPTPAVGAGQDIVATDPLHADPAALFDGAHGAASPGGAGTERHAVDGSTEPGGTRQPMRRWDDAQTTVKVDTRKLDNLIDMVGELVIAQAILAEDPAITRSADERLGRRVAQLKRITSDLQRNAMAMRMVPIRQTFQKMARLVRDLSRKSGKNIELVLDGEDTELDRRVVEDMNDPLMHMVRNSVDHGIENPADRASSGKPCQATLRLSAFHQAGNIVIEIADDGAGLNTERILAKAMERGLITEVTQLSPADVHQLIFQPGFSTAEKVTEISGRGVGMDVVRRNIEALRGQIEIQTTRGQGTTFSIRLPLTLAIVDGILLGVGNERFVMPTFAVRESLRPTPEQVHTVNGRPCMVQVRERLIPILHVGELFAVPGARQTITDGTVVVIEDNGRLIALVVDELLGKQEVVIKSLGDAFQNVKGVAGGAILGDGRIGLILDASGLAGLMGRSTLRPAA
jgi:two-component system chemotaxis sensor kinase CheA